MLSTLTMKQQNLQLEKRIVNNTTSEPVKIEPALLTIPQVCQYLNIKRATFYKIKENGAFGLLPINLSCRKILYSKAELIAWLNASPPCPHRKQWQSRKKEFQR